jgi:hypothetical protein
MQKASAQPFQHDNKIFHKHSLSISSAFVRAPVCRFDTVRQARELEKVSGSRSWRAAKQTPKQKRKEKILSAPLRFHLRRALLDLLHRRLGIAEEP